MKNKFFVFFLFAFTCLSLLLDWNFVHRSNFFKLGSLIKNEEKSNFILGSSSALTGIDTKMLGSSWRNYSMDNTTLIYQRCLLNYLLENNVDIDTLILCIDEFARRESNLTVNSYRYLPLLNYTHVFDSLFVLNQLRFNRFLPLYKYVSFNSELLYPGVFSLIRPNFRYRYDSLGDFIYPYGDNFIKDFDHLESISFSEPLELSRIKKICSKEGIKLFVVILPRKDFRVLNVSPDILDFSQRVNRNDLFYDDKHLNYSGRQYITPILKRELQKK